ncbi:hypothetical protein C1645_836223 [Glomus cerebriforme]|uniref:Uncharacterized protein n=1 Tax=Glomus cerebriforme TaxID=658196 RepID=A0A397S686_9GLOM|nr:hypothetical protein C1645_836223 [Glomus cerebriforme]
MCLVERKSLEGHLGNLGVIDDKYDIAASTACPKLNKFVTEDIDAAKRCVDYIRESSLVANDLQQATKIAHGEGGEGRWCIVTLDGELIKKSGHISRCEEIIGSQMIMLRIPDVLFQCLFYDANITQTLIIAEMKRLTRGQNIEHLWRESYHLYKIMRQKSIKDEEIDQFEADAKQWIRDFCRLTIGNLNSTNQQEGMSVLWHFSTSSIVKKNQQQIRLFFGGPIRYITLQLNIHEKQWKLKPRI